MNESVVKNPQCIMNSDFFSAVIALSKRKHVNKILPERLEISHITIPFVEYPDVLSLILEGNSVSIIRGIRIEIIDTDKETPGFENGLVHEKVLMFEREPSLFLSRMSKN